ncbi:MAG: carboxypeptidase regulatory-like domain-containing protein [Gemmatimonadota bacterium]
MYTESSAITRGLFLLTFLVAPLAGAQEPVRLPGVNVTAEWTKPGPRLMTGVVRDTGDFLLDGAEITLPAIRRRTFSKPDGTFRLDSLPRGKYEVRARKFGYAPQIRTVIVDSLGGIAEFALLPMPRALPAVIASAVRGGLSGVVADTSYNIVPGAAVRVMGKSIRTTTDSVGEFFMPLQPGSYMVAVQMEGMESKIVGVNIPSDSGRRISVFLQPPSAPRPVREAFNIEDLTQRLGARNKQLTAVYSREELQKLGIEWVIGAVNMGGMDWYSEDCAVIINGGPRTARLGNLTVDEIESVEVYGGRRDIAALVATSMANTKAGAGSGKKGVATKGAPGMKVPPLEELDRMSAMSNIDEALRRNAGVAAICPGAAYVWMR